MAKKRSIQSRAFWIIMIGGIVTGMGNGSVFGAAMMCFLGRGTFADWGGWWPLDYDPRTFTGFIDWCMIVFGVAYAVMLAVALQRHDTLERTARIADAARQSAR
jgi:hypothetical protein